MNFFDREDSPMNKLAFALGLVLTVIVVTGCGGAASVDDVGSNTGNGNNTDGDNTDSMDTDSDSTDGSDTDGDSTEGTNTDSDSTDDSDTDVDSTEGTDTGSDSTDTDDLDEIFYFNPVIGSARATISQSEYSPDQDIKNALQEGIDNINSAGGGILTIESGTYLISPTVQLKSNVHIRVDPGVTLKFASDGTLFEALSLGDVPLTNLSIIGLGEDNTATGGTDERFVVDHNTSQLGTESAPKYSTLRLGNINNFKFSDFRILDNFSNPSSIVLSAEVRTVQIASESRSRLISEVFGTPNRGIIENIDNQDGAYGYGLVQQQAGVDILYKNLSGTGGVTLRLESGLNLNQMFRPVGSVPVYVRDGIGLPLEKNQQPKIDKIVARNITNKNGHAAFTLSPHTITQGTVDLQNVSTTGSAFAGKVGDGFINNFNREEAAGLDVAAFNITPGSYSSNSVLRDVTAVFGQFAQIKSKDNKFIPCDLRVDRGVSGTDIGLSVELGPDEESRIGPALFAVDYTASEADLSDGGYIINFDRSTVISIGFGSNVPADGVITGPANDFENCDCVDAGGPFSSGFSISGKDKNTRNPLNICEA